MIKHPETTSAPTLTEFLTRWLDETVRPNLQPSTFAYYEAMVRIYITPGLGTTRLDRLQTQDVQDWLNTLPALCQCCLQGKDAARPASKQRCCAAGACCQLRTGRRTIQAARNTLRTALSHAIATDTLTTRNVASLARLPSGSRTRQHRRKPPWTVKEAHRFLASARDDEDPLHAAYVLVLACALSKGEVLGLTWPGVDLDRAELMPAWQLQRVGTDLIHQQRPDAGTTIPLPDIALAALKLRRADQDAARDLAGNRWQPGDLVFTTRWGTPIEPRNFNRSFDARCAKAGVRPIAVRDTRGTCAALLADLDVAPDVAFRILRRARLSSPFTEPGA